MTQIKKEKFKRQTKAKRIIKNVIWYTCGIILSLIFLFPIFFMIASSSKTEMSYAQDAGTFLMFLPDFRNVQTMFDNYANVLTKYDIWKYALNSFLYACIVIVLNVVINGLAGYAIAKFHFPGKRLINFLIIFLIVVPVETSIIPLYTIVKTVLNLKSELSVLAVILPASISIFNIFLFVQFFEGIPKEFEEAARLDGANTIQIFFKLILPMSKSIVATVSVFCFIGVWNDYLWPTMVLPTETKLGWPMYPIQAALTTIQSITGVTTGEVMAALIITSLPIFIIYVVAQKYIVQGFGSADLKM